MCIFSCYAVSVNCSAPLTIKGEGRNKPAALPSCLELPFFKVVRTALGTEGIRSVLSSCSNKSGILLANSCKHMLMGESFANGMTRR